MMPRTTGRMRLCIALLTANVLFIWSNSLLPGEISGAISGFVKDVVFAIFGFDSGAEQAGHGLLRKLGHLTEFACLGACLCWLLSMLGYLLRLVVVGVMLYYAFRCYRDEARPLPYIGHIDLIR